MMIPKTRDTWNRTEREQMPSSSTISPLMNQATRRQFLRRATSLAGLAVVVPGTLASLTACSSAAVEPGGYTTLDFSKESGVLNYVYALSQLEADMYLRMRRYWYVGMLNSEQSVIRDAYDYTYEQRTTLLTTQKEHRITDFLLFDYTSVNFLDRASALAMAQNIAEAAAKGYAGANAYLTTPETITQVADWATAAADRATAIRGMLALSAFVPSPASPEAVMAALDTYYRTKLALVNTGANA